MSPQVLKTGFLLLSALFFSLGQAHAFSYKKAAQNIFEVGSAFYVQGVIHEYGHTAVAHQLRASSTKMEFFTNKEDNFFFGLATASGLKENSLVSYRMGGFVFSNMTYEYALSSYRQNPSLFNETLAWLSASDFFKYSVFAFYMGDSDVEEYDPAYFQKKTGFSQEAIILTSLSQTAVNIYRLYSEDDTLVPFVHFDGDDIESSVQIGFTYKF